MAEFVRVSLGGVDVLFETDGRGGPAGYSVGERVIDAADKSLEAALDFAKRVAGAAAIQFQSLDMDSVEIAVGIKFSAEGNVVVAKAAGEASLELKFVVRGKSSSA